MKTTHHSFPPCRSLIAALAAAVLIITGGLAMRAQAGEASGGGTYSPDDGINSEFQLSPSHVQCKIAHAILNGFKLQDGTPVPDGTVLRMRMFSQSVDSVTINSSAKTVTITGSMISIVDLTFPDGGTAHLSDTVPYVAFAQDNGTPGAGVDTFSLTINYHPMPGLDQSELFGTTATFSGTLETGNVTVR